MMKFKRSLWGYSPEQVKQYLNESSMTFQARRQELESDLESITRAGQELDQLLTRLQMQLGQARQNQQTIESSMPIVDLFLNQCQNYAASQAENFIRTNEALLAEIALQTDQINVDQNKLKHFWQTLHSNLGDLLNAVELEELTGKYLLSKHASDLEARTTNLDLDIEHSEVVQHEFQSAINSMGTTPRESLPANEDTLQVGAENNSLLFVDSVSNGLEPEQALQAMVVSPKQQALITDDDATVIAMLRIILERDGFSIIECNDGYQASQSIDRIDPPLLAILETNSPNVNGLELVRKIRSKQEWDHCSIIMLTETSSEHDIVDLLEAGANDYISKPVNTRDLVARVRRHTGIAAVAL